MDLVPEHLRPAITAVVGRIAAGDFEGLKREGVHPHPDADLGLWIRAYGDHGATVGPLPEQAWLTAEAVPIDGHQGTWAVVVDLWTTDETPSDLSLEATVREIDGHVAVRIDGIHVL